MNTRLRLYLQLGKFRLSLLVVFTTAIGYGLAAEQINMPLLLCLLPGTLLCAMGANGFNQWWERDRDARMQRTRKRPLPSGKMSPGHALTQASLWSLCGLTLLYFGVNPLTSSLAATTLAVYLFIYTPLKPYSCLAVLCGAIPGAIPPVMGWTAASGDISTQAWGLACILYLWQIPHFMSLAAIYRLDYSQGGYQLLPDNPEQEHATRSIILVFSLALLGVTLMMPLIGLGDGRFIIGALLAGGMLVFFSTRLFKQYSAAAARQVFLCSVLYLPVTMTLLLLDQKLFSLMLPVPG